MNKTPKIIITPSAHKKMSDIIKFSSKRWGEKAAKEYFSRIKKTIASVSSGDIKVKTSKKFSLRFKYCRVKKHYIFFEFKGDTMVVVDLFHTSMDIKSKIEEIK